MVPQLQKLQSSSESQIYHSLITPLLHQGNYQNTCLYQNLKQKNQKNKVVSYYQEDRFIPNRIGTSNQVSMFLLSQKKNQIQDSTSTYEKMIAENILSQSSQSDNTRIINYKKPTPLKQGKVPRLLKQKSNSSLYSTVPIKILDAPQIKDDYYLNLLDWSNSNILSILLGSTAYLYTPGRIWTLDVLQIGYLCSVSFSPRGNAIIIGTSTGSLRLYDVQKVRLLRQISGHSSRVSSLQWSTGGIVYSGGKDSKIIGHDVRSNRNLQFYLEGHRGEVCGMKEDGYNGTQLATGGNDNLLMIWDLNMLSCRNILTGHKAAVKALAWCPWKRNLLASGGGTSDKSIKFWNIDNGQMINNTITDSQVCALLWNKYDKQIVSSHGYSKNQITIWRYPVLTKIGELQGHQDRVLQMSLSPDGSTVCTASADQTLRFWKLFEIPEDYAQQKKSISSLNGLFIR